MNEEVGTVISRNESPNPDKVYFVVTNDIIHKGQFVQISVDSGNLIALVINVFKTNRYFERADSVKEFESKGSALLEQFPADEWEYLIAETKPLGILDKDNYSKRATFPVSPGTKVKIAENINLEKFFRFDENGMHLGEIQFHGVPVKINLTNMLQKHLAILAMSGSGKCGRGDLNVLLGSGKTIQLKALVDPELEKEKTVFDDSEVAYPENLEVISLNKEGKFAPSKVMAVSRRKSPEKLIAIRTRSGRDLYVTKEHLIPVLSDSIIWKESQSLHIKDVLLLPKPVISAGKAKTIDAFELLLEYKHAKIMDKKILNILKNRIKTKNLTLKYLAKKFGINAASLSEQLANGISLKNMKNISEELSLDLNSLKKEAGFIYCKKKKKIPVFISINSEFSKLFAFLLAEGHNSLDAISFTNYNSKIQEEFVSSFLNVFNESPKKTKVKGVFIVNSKLICILFNKLGFTNSSWTKFVFPEFLESEEKVLSAFLSAFIDCDGFVDKKKPIVDITLAKNQLFKDINNILLRLQIVPILSERIIDKKTYSRMVISGVKNLILLDSNVHLLCDYKHERLKSHLEKTSNTNLDVVQNVKNHFIKLQKLLRLSNSLNQRHDILDYLYHNSNPSKDSLSKIITAFEGRMNELNEAAAEAENLFMITPDITKKRALDFISSKYGEKDFNEMSLNSGVSSNTARRMVRGITAATNNVFLLANNIVQSDEIEYFELQKFKEIDLKNVSENVLKIAKTLGIELKELNKASNVNKSYLYQSIFEDNNPDYDTLKQMIELVYGESLEILNNLSEAHEIINFLKVLASDEFYFDPIVEIKEIDSKEEFVYDLAVEEKNFIANNLLIHNSYGVSCLLEEILDRTPEQGRIGIVVFDPHGEYSSFGFKPENNDLVDYSDKTFIIKGRNIRVGVSNLDLSMLSNLIPGISSPQRRDLGRIMNSLNKQIKEGLGPFDLKQVTKSIQEDEEIKFNTKQALLAWIHELDSIYLFSKIDSPSIKDIIKPGVLTVIDLSDVIDMRKKQIIVSYFSKKIFNARRIKVIPPLLMVFEEAHQFVPQYSNEETSVSRNIIQTIAREGRKFGTSLCLISQRPARLDTTTLSQCGTNIILRITNPNDLKFIEQSSEAIDYRSLSMINSLQVGEAILTGEAVRFPLFFKFRNRKSVPSIHEKSIEAAAKEFEENKSKDLKEAEEFL